MTKNVRAIISGLGIIALLWLGADAVQFALGLGDGWDFASTLATLLFVGGALWVAYILGWDDGWKARKKAKRRG